MLPELVGPNNALRKETSLSQRLEFQAPQENPASKPTRYLFLDVSAQLADTVL